MLWYSITKESEEKWRQAWERKEALKARYVKTIKKAFTIPDTTTD